METDLPMAIHLPETAFHSPRRITHRSLICIVFWLEVQFLFFPSPQAHRFDGLCCFNPPSELPLGDRPAEVTSPGAGAECRPQHIGGGCNVLWLGKRRRPHRWAENLGFLLFTTSSCHCVLLCSLPRTRWTACRYFSE